MAQGLVPRPLGHLPPLTLPVLEEYTKDFGRTNPGSAGGRDQGSSPGRQPAMATCVAVAGWLPWRRAPVRWPGATSPRGNAISF